MAQKANKTSLPAKASRTQNQAQASPEHSRVVQGKSSESMQRDLVSRIVQAKLKVGAANDPAEHEADMMAELVVNGQSEKVAAPPGGEGVTAVGAMRVLPWVSRWRQVTESADLMREEEAELKRSEEEADLMREEEAELMRSEEEADLMREEEAELKRSEEEADLMREEEAELKRSEEEADLMREEEADLMRSEEEADLMRSEEEADLMREEEAELMRSEEEADLMRSEEEADMMRSAEEAEMKREEEEAALKREDELQLVAENDIQEQAAPVIQPAIDAAPVAPVQREAEEEIQEQEEEMQREESEKILEQAVADPPPPETSRSTLQREEEEQAYAKGLAREAPANHKEGFTTSDSMHQKIKGRDGQGKELPAAIRTKMEAGFGVDFGQVRIHTDKEAADISQSLGARAFTYGRNLYFNTGEYQPFTHAGQILLAHELTHVVQQGKAPRLSMMAIREVTASRSEEGEEVQASFRDILDDLLSLASKAGIDIPEIVDNIPGYTLFSYVVGYDVIRGTNVERNGPNLVGGLMGLLGPLGNLLYDKLNEYGLIDRAFAWIEDQLTTLDLSLNRLQNALSSAWDEMGLFEGIQGNLNILARHFQPILDDVETFARNAGNELLEIVKEGLLTPLVGFLEENSPEYVLATKVIGKKFPLDDEVEAPTVEILKDFLLLIGKETEVAEMEEKGTLQETADWIDTQLERFYGLLGRFGEIIVRVFEAFSMESLQDIPGVFTGIWNDFMVLLQDFLDFALEVAIKVLELIKNALLAWLASFADEIPGFHLVTVIIEKDPFTEEVVERTTENIIRGFMGLVPGGEEKYQKLKETGVVPRAAAQIDQLIEELGISWPFIRDLFIGIWDSLTIDDLLDPIAAFHRIMDEYGEPIGRLFKFVKKMVMIVVELILEMMNFPLDLVRQIIANVKDAFGKIKEDPIGFLINLLDAVKLGFTQFFDNILTHLFNGVTNWLFGQLGEAGITIPPDFSLGSILGMAMEILGITTDNIFERLALKIGQEKVDQIKSVMDTLTGIWEFVRDVMERGPIAIWEYIQEKISDLWDMVLGGIMDWIQTRIITAVTTKLLSMLDPTGIMAVVNSFIAFYNAVQSFIEKLREILEIINTFVLGVIDIANGNIQNAANFLEKALADGIPVAIAFLAKQVNLDKLGEKIGEMIEKVREKINLAIDWLIDKALAAGNALMAMLGMGPEGEEEEGASGEDAEKHKEIGEAVERALHERPAEEPGSFEEFYALKKKQAEDLEKKYQPELKEGIKISITFGDLAQEKADGDLDFKVLIAPNDYVATFEVDGNADVAIFKRLLMDALEKVAAEFGVAWDNSTFEEGKQTLNEREVGDPVVTAQAAADEKARLDAEREAEIAAAEKTGNEIHDKINKSLLDYRSASRAQYVPNNTFNVGGGQFFVETLSNYYIVPRDEGEANFSYALGGTSAEQALKGSVDSLTAKSDADRINDEISQHRKILKRLNKSIPGMLRGFPQFAAYQTVPVEPFASTPLATSHPHLEVKYNTFTKMVEDHRHSTAEVATLTATLNSDDTKAREAQIASLKTIYQETPKDGDWNSRALTFIKENTTLPTLDNYTNRNVTIAVEDWVIKKYPYHAAGSDPLTPEAAKLLYEGYPGSITDSGIKNTLFVATLLAEPPRRAVAHITNLLLFNDDSDLIANQDKPTRRPTAEEQTEIDTKVAAGNYVDDTGVFDHTSGSQRGSDPKKETHGEYIAEGITDPALAREGEALHNRNVSDREFAAVARNATLKGQLEDIFNSKYTDDNSKVPVVDEMSLKIKDHLQLNPAP